MLQEALVSTRKVRPEAASVRYSRGPLAEVVFMIHQRRPRFRPAAQARSRVPGSGGLPLQTAEGRSSSHSSNEVPETSYGCTLTGRLTAWRQKTPAKQNAAGMAVPLLPGPPVVEYCPRQCCRAGAGARAGGAEIILTSWSRNQSRN